MVVRELNEKGILLLSSILTILAMFILIEVNIDHILCMLLIPFNFGIGLMISSKVKIITKKELAKPAKVKD